ncbi:MAG TPA: sce7726 family protein [Draconibacterium sp.]|nr:sce7726 family protein [Draconibacterium sp.]
MKTVGGYTELDKMRSYSTVFSSTSFSKILKGDDLSFIDAKIKRFDKDKLQSKGITTYLHYIQYIYRQLSENYRNEYFYKNSFINQLLLKEYGVKNTVAVNEFRVGNSIADIVLFNGSSKAFEIKTELDSKQRLKSQIADYTKIFDECYIITDESLIDKYSKENQSIGLIALKKLPRSVKMMEVRKAHKTEFIDSETLIRCIRTSEYKNIVSKFYGELPEMNSFNMFEICRQLMKEIPSVELKQLFIDEVKNRRTNTLLLKSFDKELRQLALAMQINEKKYQYLLSRLNNPINL